MSFDLLQQRIRHLKCPLALCLSPSWEALPPVLRKDTPATPEGKAEAYVRFGRALLEALRDTLPAVWLRSDPFLALGGQGMGAMEALAAIARDLGYFLLADVPLLEPSSAPMAAQAYLGREGLDLPCAVLSGALGSDGLRPFLRLCGQEEKSIFVQIRGTGPNAGEIQDLIAGDRVVYQALGDLVQRLGRELGEPKGYTPAGAAAALPYPSDLRTLRKRLEKTFLLITNYGDGLTAEDARFAFDPYGRGALLSDGGASANAWRASGGDGSDFASAALSAARSLRDDIRQYVTFL